MPPPEPIGVSLDAKDVKEKYFKGGIIQASLEDIPKVNYIILYWSNFKTCKEYFDSLPNLSHQEAAYVWLFDTYKN